MIPIMLAHATNIAWSPWSSEQIHANRFDRVRKASYYYIFMFLIVVFAIFLLGPEIVLFLGGKQYAQAIYVLPPVVMGAVFQFLYNLYVALEQFAKKTIGMAIGTVVAALINIGLNWIFIPKFGYIAAAYTTLVGYACLLVIHYYLAQRTGYAAAYNEKYIFLSVLLLFCLMLAILWMYGVSSIIRYSIAAVFFVAFLVLGYRNKETIKQIIKR